MISPYLPRSPLWQASIDGLRARVHALQMQLEMAKESAAMSGAGTSAGSSHVAAVAAAQSAATLAAQQVRPFSCLRMPSDAFG